MVDTLAHRYGQNIHLFDDSFLATLLARIGDPKVGTAELPGLVRTGYQRMLHEVLANEFPRTVQRHATRMTAQEPRAFVSGPHQALVFPHLLYESFNDLLGTHSLRLGSKVGDYAVAEDGTCHCLDILKGRHVIPTQGGSTLGSEDKILDSPRTCSPADVFLDP